MLWWERPRDLPVALDRLLADPVLGPRIDTHAELAASDSIARASLARVGASYRDARVRAVFGIAPAIGHAVTRDSLAAIRTRSSWWWARSGTTPS